jgi:hypothetical protein
MNNTGASVFYTKLTATFYDAGGRIMGTDYSYSRFTMIPAGGKSPFTIMVQPAAGWTRYEVRVESYNTSSYTTYNRNLTILNTNSYWSGSWYYIVGEVRNDTSETWRFVEVVATFYDAAGCAIDSDFTYVASTDLAPGQQSTFSMMNSGSHLGATPIYVLGSESWH